MSKHATTPQRRRPASGKPWTPRNYQKRAVKFLLEHAAAALFLDPGLGKLQPVDTPVYTPAGWREIGEIRPGDFVYGASGQPTRVLGVFPQADRRCVRVSFQDGTSTRCGPDHLWTVAGTTWSASRPLTNARAWRTLTAADIVALGVARPKLCGRKGAHWRVPVPAAVMHPDADLLIEPYALGALIGDGALTLRSAVALSVPPHKAAVLHAVAAGTPYVTWRLTQSEAACPRATATPHAALSSRLASLGLKWARSPERFIPASYKLGSVEQRKALLRGLMDTDGSCRFNRVTFHTMSARLAADVAELTRSLGGLAVIREYHRDAKGVEFQVNVKTTFCPFLHYPWQGRWRPHKLAKIITAIEPVADAEQVCIAVEDPLGLYLTNDFIVTHNTSTVLAAFSYLKKRKVASKMLVIAPLRVCNEVWPAEVAEWRDFNGLGVSVLHGKGKEKRFGADICCINPEGLPWLLKRRELKQFDTLVIDELTRFKNGQGLRYKLLKAELNGFSRRWGLTGTPTPNGLLDLFAQCYVLDQGNALGRFITHYRSKYFYNPDGNGWVWKPLPGAEAKIHERIRPLALTMRAEDYLELPELVDVFSMLTLPPEAAAIYTAMEDEFVAQLDAGELVAANVAASRMKLWQVANGGVYMDSEAGEPRQTVELHTAKTDWLLELIEELQGAPLLVAYTFKHDLDRLRKALKDDNLPYIGGGVSARQTALTLAAWNAGELPVLAVHPASASHGLNMQKGNAAHLAMFSMTWNLEHYDQLLRRILRQGNKAQRVFRHHAIMRGTVDEDMRKALLRKDVSQESLLSALRSRVKVRVG